MPYNIFYVVVLAILVGIVVGLLTRFGKPAARAQVLPETAFEERARHAFGRPVGADALRELALRLFQRYTIAVESETDTETGDLQITGTSSDPITGGRYGMICHVAADDAEVLPPERILQFRDLVKAQGWTRGIFLSTGYFAKESRFLVEDAPVSLLSRGDVKQLLEQA